jgi:hypothetical protein
MVELCQEPPITGQGTSSQRTSQRALGGDTEVSIDESLGSAVMK